MDEAQGGVKPDFWTNRPGRSPVAAITRRASARPEIPNSLLRRYDRT